MTAVFLDLDGTLMDSKPGIVASLKHAFTSTGHGDLAEEDLTWMIGPPFQDSFEKLGIQEPEPVLEAYRTHYQADGMYQAQVYEGVTEMISALEETGARLYLATAKPHAYATKITAHFGLAPSLKREFGPELDGTRGWKGDLLAYALDVTGETPDRAVMVGDRHHDIAAGHQVGMATLAVTWGYGSEGEWKDAHGIVKSPGEVVQAIAGLSLGR